MNRQMVLVVTGKVVFLIGVLMCLPIIVALYYQEEWTSLAPLLKATATTLLCGGLFAFRKPKNKSIYVREALAITGLSWLLTVFFGALPFIFSEAIPSFIDAIFERNQDQAEKLLVDHLEKCYAFANTLPHNPLKEKKKSPDEEK